MVLKMTSLLVGNYMTAYPISVKPTVSFKTVIDFMAENGFATLIVMEEQSIIPLGVLTEREVLRYVVSEGKIPDKQVKDLQIQPFVSVTPGTTVLEAAKLMISKKSRVLVFADNNMLVGIITASDMLRAFRKTIISPPIDKVMSTKVHQCTYDDSILDASKIMHEQKIGSVIVSKGSLYGIFTQRDLMHVLQKEIEMTSKVGDYSSFPLVTAKKGILANEAASIMAANNLKRLVLTENDIPVGVVTARDIVDAFQMEVA